MVGSRGFIDLGISSSATVEFVKINHRRRRHRLTDLNHIEDEIEGVTLNVENDVSLWRDKGDKYKKNFSSKRTLHQIRNVQPTQEWYKGVWFKHSTPKYSFFTWLAIHNRLSTGDRMRTWNINQQNDCVFCRARNESRNHLFFHCHYSAEVWRKLMGTFMDNRFSLDWDQLVAMLTGTTYDTLQLFIFRYAFQSALYHLWRERNGRRHGEAPTPPARLTSLIDKNIRNRFSSIRSNRNQADHVYHSGLTLWFATRSQ